MDLIQDMKKKNKSSIMKQPQHLCASLLFDSHQHNWSVLSLQSKTNVFY